MGHEKDRKSALIFSPFLMSLDIATLEEKVLQAEESTNLEGKGEFFMH